jgi:hypothetical protein
MAIKETLNRKALKLTVVRDDLNGWTAVDVAGEEAICSYATREEAIAAAKEEYEIRVDTEMDRIESDYQDALDQEASDAEWERQEELERLEEERQEREEAERDEILERIGECDIETLRKMVAILK